MNLTNITLPTPRDEIVPHGPINGYFFFSNRLKQKRLTPVQEHLRQGLEDFARLSFPVITWRRSDLNPLFFQVEVDSEIVQVGESHEIHEDTAVEQQKEEDGESHTSDEEVEVEEESEELAEGDTEEMRFFRTLFRRRWGVSRAGKFGVMNPNTTSEKQLNDIFHIFFFPLRFTGWCILTRDNEDVVRQAGLPF